MSNFKNNKTIIIFLLFSLILLFAGSVSAANQKITNVTSQSEIQEIISGNHSSINLNSGDTLTFSSGTYNWDVNRGIIVNRGIKIVGEGNVRIIGNGNTSTNNTINTAFNVTANNVKISKLSISRFFYGIHTTARNTNISHCTIFNNRRGVNTNGATNFALENSNIHNNEREAVNLNGEKFTVKNNIMRNNGFEAIHGHGVNSLVTNNTIIGNARPGMAAVDFHIHDGSSMKGLIFSDNVVRSNKGIGIILIAHDNAKFFNNKIYNNAETGIIITNETNKNNNIYSNRIYKNLNGIENYGVKTSLSNNKIYHNTKNQVVNTAKDFIRNGNLINGNNESKSKVINANIKNLVYRYSVSKFTVQKGKSTTLKTEIKNSAKSNSKRMGVRITLPQGMIISSVNNKKYFNNKKNTWNLSVPAKKTINLKVALISNSVGNKKLSLNVNGQKQSVSLVVV
ncbi:MAG: right-handed parallel beta-helix repeat-containing protein [Methanobrevibacter sp.]|nr:right-handed parallel beta-helix repeat-containing protein [Methanobrevibacter sp.]